MKFHGRDHEQYLTEFARQYMIKWILAQEEGLEKNLGPLFYFQTNTDFQKAFKQIAKGEDNPAEIFFPVSNARLKFKRFGNCLGMILLSNNTPSRDEIHVNGTELLRSFCANGQSRIQEFVHSIECVLPLPRKHGENNSVTVDFGRVYAQIKKACPYFSWNDLDVFRNKLFAGYISPSNNLVPAWQVGWQKSKGKTLVIYGALRHLNETPEQKAVQWKRGNVEDVSKEVYRFFHGRDLCLSIRISGSLSQSTFMKAVDPELDIAKEQDELLLAGATLYSQLCAMVSNGVFEP